MTALSIPEGLEPVGAWDAGPGWVDEHVDEKIAWARDHIDRVNDTYRVEFYATRPPLAVVHRFAVNAEGRKYKPATEPPAVEPLDELPPERLLRPA